MPPKKTVPKKAKVNKKNAVQKVGVEAKLKNEEYLKKALAFALGTDQVSQTGHQFVAVEDCSFSCAGDEQIADPLDLSQKSNNASDSQINTDFSFDGQNLENTELFPMPASPSIAEFRPKQSPPPTSPMPLSAKDLRGALRLSDFMYLSCNAHEAWSMTFAGPTASPPTFLLNPFTLIFHHYHNIGYHYQNNMLVTKSWTARAPLKDLPYPVPLPSDNQYLQQPPVQNISPRTTIPSIADFRPQQSPPPTAPMPLSAKDLPSPVPLPPDNHYLQQPPVQNISPRTTTPSIAEFRPQLSPPPTSPMQLSAKDLPSPVPLPPDNLQQPSQQPPVQNLSPSAERENFGENLISTRYKSMEAKYQQKSSALKREKEKNENLKLKVSELKDLVVDAAAAAKKARNNDAHAVITFSTDPAIEMTSEQIEQINVVSKNVGNFAQNLAMHLYGAENLRHKSVTGRQSSRSTNDEPRPAISPEKLKFIQNKAQERVALELGANSLQQVTTLAHKAIINRALAEKISNLNKAVRYAEARAQERKGEAEK